ncbi:hypothetical protein FIV42_25285 [Persicimonas caeni]|uniref:Uncharacterized protein n=1 Tax=Persicimonas caeni TaxID=2292766 RepID=A0A4Y6Q039_PERCE|nr:hypothetical protein [Persicimonas caeni]QDG53936.1 hypothetical protein FIV42_25285 [Persicimonas caeni]QED35157.1 hypothetical protein FRD00_25280 [Persicimonas caeni]
MDPITIASLVGTGLVCGLGGFVVGTRRDGSSEQTPAAPTRPPKDPRVDELTHENNMLRKLTGLGTPRRMLSAEVLGEHHDFLERQLAELVSCNHVRAAAFFDADGLVVAGQDRTPDVRMLASVFATALSLRVRNESFRRIDWVDSGGHRFEFHALGDNGRLFLGVWAVSAEVPRSAVARIRYACAGLTGEGTSSAKVSQTVRADGTRWEELFEPFTSAMDVIQIGVVTPDGKTASLAASGSTPLTDDLRSVASRLDRLGHRSEAFDVGDTEYLVFTSPGGRRFGFHPLETSDGRVAFLYLETPADQDYPEQRMRKWLGQLAWRLPRVEFESGEPDTPDRQPAQQSSGGQ